MCLEFDFNIFMIQDGPGISGRGDLIIDLNDGLVNSIMFGNFVSALIRMMKTSGW